MFKVGDAVRRVSEFDDLDLPHGFVTAVTEVCEGGFFRHYDAAGDLRHRHSDEYELDSTAPIGPVVTETVTKTRIVPGVYDGVEVYEDTNEGGWVVEIEPIRVDGDTADRLAAVLSALAKGLRDA